MAASRRGVLSGVAALLTNAVTVDSAGASSSEPDAELLAVCRRFQAIFDRMQVLNRHGCPDDVMNAAATEWHAAVAAVTDAPAAQSAAGVRARLVTARAIHQDRVTEHFWRPFNAAAENEDLLIDDALADALAGGLS